MKVAILGSNGFVGKSLCHIFKDKFTIIPVTRLDLNLTNFNEVDSWLNKCAPDIIVNCATAGGKQALSKQEVNYSELQNNLTIFLNFYNNKKTKKFINVGSGAEFEKSRDLSNIKEDEILNICPVDTYSYSKNIISRLVLNRENFYTLRLFGCFGKFEPDFRLFKKLNESISIELIDRYFDYISVKDYANIVEYYILNQGLPKDVNCVYKEKNKLSTIVDKFIDIHKLRTEVVIKSTTNENYTGNADRLNRLGIYLEGLESGIKKYFL